MDPFVAPGRPVTFVVDGCLVVVARDAGTYRVGLRGSLIRRNCHAVGEVLEVVIRAAEAVDLSLRCLDELDAHAGSMLNDIASAALRSHVTWQIVDGHLVWQTALNECRATSSANDRYVTGRPFAAPFRAGSCWATNGETSCRAHESDHAHGFGDVAARWNRRTHLEPVSDELVRGVAGTASAERLFGALGIDSTSAGTEARQLLVRPGSHSTISWPAASQRSRLPWPPRC